MIDKNLLVLHSECHHCWCPGHTRSQAIPKHGIDLGCQTNFSQSTRRGKGSVNDTSVDRLQLFGGVPSSREQNIPDNKVHGANMGSTWVLSAPDGPHVGPMNLAIWDIYEHETITAVLSSYFKTVGILLLLNCSNCLQVVSGHQSSVFTTRGMGTWWRHQMETFSA